MLPNSLISCRTRRLPIIRRCAVWYVVWLDSRCLGRSSFTVQRCSRCRDPFVPLARWLKDQMEHRMRQGRLFPVVDRAAAFIDDFFRKRSTGTTPRFRSRSIHGGACVGVLVEVNLIAGKITGSMKAVADGSSPGLGVSRTRIASCKRSVVFLRFTTTTGLGKATRTAWLGSTVCAGLILGDVAIGSVASAGRRKPHSVS